MTATHVLVPVGVLNDVFDLLDGVDDAFYVRADLLSALATPRAPVDVVERVIAISREWGDGKPISKPFAQAIVAACASPREKALVDCIKSLIPLIWVASGDDESARKVEAGRALLGEGK